MLSIILRPVSDVMCVTDVVFTMERLEYKFKIESLAQEICLVCHRCDTWMQATEFSFIQGGGGNSKKIKHFEQ